MNPAQPAQNWIVLALLLSRFFCVTNEIIIYHLPSQLHSSNLRQFRFVIHSIIDRTQLAQNWTVLALLINERPFA